jgi:hypothetical protein
MLFCVIFRNREQFHTSIVLILVIAPRFCKFGGGISLLGRANGRWLLVDTWYFVSHQCLIEMLWVG